jgi:hypothetical protein
VLHLGARLIGNPVATSWSVAAQSQLAQLPCERGIANLDLLFFEELLMDALHPSITLAVQTLEQFGVDLNSVLPLDASELSLLPGDGPHGIAADLQAAADLPQRHPSLV